MHCLEYGMTSEGSLTAIVFWSCRGEAFLHKCLRMALNGFLALGEGVFAFLVCQVE